jgi:hypothetical protein
VGDQHVNPTEARPPCWRKTQATRVDNKVARLFESYKLIDEAQAAGGSHRQRQGSDYSRHSSAGMGRHENQSQ